MKKGDSEKKKKKMKEKQCGKSGGMGKRTLDLGLFFFSRKCVLGGAKRKKGGC
jgi:hypothetical protein